MPELGRDGVLHPKRSFRAAQAQPRREGVLGTHARRHRGGELRVGGVGEHPAEAFVYLVDDPLGVRAFHRKGIAEQAAEHMHTIDPQI